MSQEPTTLELHGWTVTFDPQAFAQAIAEGTARQLAEEPGADQPQPEEAA